MRAYELAFIIKPTVDDDGVKTVMDKVTQFVGAASGEITSTDIWGRRKLAYPIQKYREGTYVLCQANISPAAITGLERSLKLSEDILRHMLIKVDS